MEYVLIATMAFLVVFYDYDSTVRMHFKARIIACIISLKECNEDLLSLQETTLFVLGCKYTHSFNYHFININVFISKALIKFLQSLLKVL